LWSLVCVERLYWDVWHLGRRPRCRYGICLIVIFIYPFADGLSECFRHIAMSTPELICNFYSELFFELIRDCCIHSCHNLIIYLLVYNICVLVFVCIYITKLYSICPLICNRSFMIEIKLLSVVALMLTAILSVIMLFVFLDYYIFKRIVRDFVDAVSMLLDTIEDDKIIDDEVKKIIVKIKYLIVRARKLIGS